MRWTSLAFAFALALGASAAHAQQTANLSVSVKNHKFQPAELHAPANVPIVITVRNLDSTQMEFESVSLRVEKVVGGNGQASVRIRPLAAGRYEFYDDFNQQADGMLVVK
jgi:cupredoxin-like protein